MNEDSILIGRNTMIEIIQLDKENYSGKEFTLKYKTEGYYDIESTATGFKINYKTFDEPKEMSFGDVFFNEWLDNPKAFGAFENGQLLGYVEGTLEKWNNRYRISNICVFDASKRYNGIGSLLMELILSEAVKSGARMVVLETQTCNENAISFYKKHGFEIIGFDLFAYSNADQERHEVRIEMGKG